LPTASQPPTAARALAAGRNPRHTNSPAATSSPGAGGAGTGPDQRRRQAPPAAGGPVQRPRKQRKDRCWKPSPGWPTTTSMLTAASRWPPTRRVDRRQGQLKTSTRASYLETYRCVLQARIGHLRLVDLRDNTSMTSTRPYANWRRTRKPASHCAAASASARRPRQALSPARLRRSTAPPQRLNTAVKRRKSATAQPSTSSSPAAAQEANRVDNRGGLTLASHRPASRPGHGVDARTHRRLS